MVERFCARRLADGRSPILAHEMMPREVKIMTCARCNGQGAITCTRCLGTGNNYDAGSLLLSRDYRICKGVKEIQCPACLGRPARMLAEPNEIESVSKNNDANVRNREFTTARRVLAIHYLLDGFQVDFGNKQAEVRFIKFLIDRDESDIKAKLTEIRERENPPDKRSKKVVPRSAKQRQEDLPFIRPYFEDLKLTRITNAIDDEIGSTVEDG